MAKIICSSTKNVPAYALPYLINNDESGLTPANFCAINDWVDETWSTLLYQTRGYLNIVPVDPDFEASFCSTPAFGLPCDCVACDCVITV
jgi:hypothetical protein